MGRYDNTQKKVGCGSTPDESQCGPSSAAVPNIIPTQVQDNQEGCLVIGTEYRTQVFTQALGCKQPTSPHATEQLDSYTQDPSPGTDGEELLQDGPRNPTGDSGYGGSGLKGIICTSEHINSSVQHVQPVNQLNDKIITQDIGYDSDKAQDDESSPQTHLSPVTSTTTPQLMSAATTQQFMLGSSHQESLSPHREPVSSTLKNSSQKTMTLGTRKLLDTGQWNMASSPNDDSVRLNTSDSAYPSQIHSSSVIKHDLDPHNANTLFSYPPNSMVVSGVNATLLSLSINNATYVHGSFLTPVACERDPLYRTPSHKYFYAVAGD